MSQNHKENKGNKYNLNPTFANQVAENHVKHPGQNNPSEGARK